MQRETATQWQDLPHHFRPRTELRITAEPTCDCGRPIRDELHAETAIQLAAMHETGPQTLPTIKGS